MGDSAFEQSAKKQTTSAGKFMGRSIIYGKEDDHNTPYMTRYWIGRLRLHIFHRGDADPDCHDHPWDFWTFPLVSYVEEIVEKRRYPAANATWVERFEKRRQVVPAFRLTFRPATHCHRVLGSYGGNVCFPAGTIVPTSARLAAAYPASVEPFRHDPSREIVTIVWRSADKRDWGFLKNRDGKWCWIAWREYVFGGGKHGPCE